MYTVFPKTAEQYKNCPEEETWKSPLPQDFDQLEDAVAWMEELKKEGFTPVMEWTKGETV